VNNIDVIELIPIIEISNYHEGIKLPENGPYWEFQDDWEEYNQKCNQLSGFSNGLKSYKRGSSFYKIHTASNEDLLKLIEVKMEDYDENDGLELKECLMPFYGGMILKINNEDVLFPQCCSDLSSINDWKGLLNNECHYFYCGHPFPKVSIEDEEIIFDFVNIQIKEKFCPPIQYDKISLGKKELATAVYNAEELLINFATRLHQINSEFKLEIPEIDKIFVFGFD